MSKGSNRLFGLLKETVIVVAAALLISTLVRLFLFQVFAIPSASMENTLTLGDRVAVQKVQPFKRGDVVVFRDDQEWLGSPDRLEAPAWRDVIVFIGLMPDEADHYLIKRVMGIEGDHVVCCDAQGRVSVNGVGLDESAYLKTVNGQGVEPSRAAFDVVVPAGRVFVMGDNRPNSADSRCHLSDDYSEIVGIEAFPRADSIVGPAIITIFPFDRWRSFSVPDVFASIPDAAGPPPSKPIIVGEPVQC